MRQLLPARHCAALLLACAAGLASGLAAAQDAQALRAKHAAVKEQLASSAFGRPMTIESVEKDGNLKGDVYAVAMQPFAVTAPALQGMDHWCDILMLHLNVKQCSWRGSGNDSTLSVSVGRKFDQPVKDANKVDFNYHLITSSADYLQVKLDADEGPLGTTDYRIVLEAIPLDAKTSFVHMSYSYSHGMAAKIAMQAYLSTIGRDKVGFTVVGRKPDGSPVYMGGVRGVIERNAMRYYLAIDAHLAASTLPRAEHAESRIRAWIDSTQRYALQLHEMERDEYLTMKRKEIARQQTAVAKGD
jgi:hypothetical protein